MSPTSCNGSSSTTARDSAEPLPSQSFNGLWHLSQPRRASGSEDCESARSLLSDDSQNGLASLLAGVEPLALHYQNLKKALQDGFCDPGMYRGGQTKTGVPPLLTDLSEEEDDDELPQQEEELYYVVVTRPGEGSRRTKIARVLERVISFLLLLWLTCRALRLLDETFGVIELRPKDPSEASYFAISPSDASFR